MTIRNQLICTWSAAIFVALGLAGFLIADFVPPISPALSANEVAALYAGNALSMRLAVLLIMSGGGFIVPFVAVISMQLKRVEGEIGP